MFLGPGAIPDHILKRKTGIGDDRRALWGRNTGTGDRYGHIQRIVAVLGSRHVGAGVGHVVRGGDERCGGADAIIAGIDKNIVIVGLQGGGLADRYPGPHLWM